MHAAFLVVAAALAAQPVKTTPLEMLQACYFNDARADAMLHHVVEVSSVVTTIERDGIGGYIVHLDARMQTPTVIGRANISCCFDRTQQAALARIQPGAVVTLRGVVREIDDRLDWLVDSRVKITLRNCEVAAGGE